MEQWPELSKASFLLSSWRRGGPRWGTRVTRLSSSPVEPWNEVTRTWHLPTILCQFTHPKKWLVQCTLTSAFKLGRYRGYLRISYSRLGGRQDAAWRSNKPWNRAEGSLRLARAVGTAGRTGMSRSHDSSRSTRWPPFCRLAGFFLSTVSLPWSVHSFWLYHVFRCFFGSVWASGYYW